MNIDVAIIGGGPAGLNAALVLGRARRNVVLFDDNKPRNAVTHASHGFITRDGVKPSEFREAAHRDIAKYPVTVRQERVATIQQSDEGFTIQCDNGETYRAGRIVLATGLKEIFPAIDGLREHYGRSLFNCPYCDGWELRDKPLFVLAEGEGLFHLAKMVHNWSRDLVVCTNGQSNLTSEQLAVLSGKAIRVDDHKVLKFIGSDGQLERVVLANGEELVREGGFIAPQLVPASSFGSELGCRLDALGRVLTDELGRTNVKGVYAAGDASAFAPTQLILAAAGGARAAFGVNVDMIEEAFAE